MLTLPPAPSWASTMLGTVWPAAMLTLDASGRRLPVGHTVRKLPSVGSVAVTFRATACAPADTPPTPATCRSIGLPGTDRAQDAAGAVACVEQALGRQRLQSDVAARA